MAKLPLKSNVLQLINLLTTISLKFAKDLPQIADDPYQYVFDVLTGDYKESSVRTAVYDLVKVGDLERVQDQEGRTFLRLTMQGVDTLSATLNIDKLARHSWDHWWRLVIFDVPEEHRRIRDELRQKLEDLGLGMWQRSVWITPHPIENELSEFLKSQRLERFAVALKAEQIEGLDAKEVANQVWKLNQLNEAYEKLVTKWYEEIGPQAGVVKPSDWMRNCWEWNQDFMRLLRKDPVLPVELLPQPWHGGEAKRIYRELSRLKPTK